MSYSVIIDPGHGGSDSGAQAFGVKEKDWNLKMSLYQYRRLKERGIQVALTRNADQTLDYISRTAKVKDRYDFCLSNHFNASGVGGRGIEGIHSIKASPDFARSLVRAVGEASALPVRRVFTRQWGERDYYFMHRLTGRTQTVILEYGFLDHPVDFRFYKNEKNFYRVADAVVDELVRWCWPRKGGKQALSASKNYQGKRLVSIYPEPVRFYKRPSWQDKDVWGYLEQGIGFPRVLDKISVAGFPQYQVANSKGEIYYVTANPTYVRLV